LRTFAAATPSLTSGWLQFFNSFEQGVDLCNRKIDFLGLVAVAMDSASFDRMDLGLAASAKR
jgi:hypothetical protein